MILGFVVGLRPELSPARALFSSLSLRAEGSAADGPRGKELQAEGNKTGGKTDEKNH